MATALDATSRVKVGVGHHARARAQSGAFVAMEIGGAEPRTRTVLAGLSAMAPRMMR